MTESADTPADVPEIRQASEILADRVSSHAAGDTLVSLVPEGVEVLVQD